MASVKLNVLHFHFTDYGRYAVESKNFPSLSQGLQGDWAGFYTTDEVTSIVEYAADHGVRVVPEFDVPGHARGLRFLGENEADFCTKEKTILANTDATRNTLKILFEELIPLFPDNVFHMGSDETSAKESNCTTEEIQELGRYVQRLLIQHGKRPAAWDEIVVANPVTKNLIVDVWHMIAGTIVKSWTSVISAKDHFYFNLSPTDASPAGWKNTIYDITTDVDKQDQKNILGGSASLWTDNYCPIQSCKDTGKEGVARSLFPPSADHVFRKSASGLLWPRGFVTAQAFWGFNDTFIHSVDFEQLVYKHINRTLKEGRISCPQSCTCDYLNACGNPYMS